jgi:hypothetical protein
MQVLETKHLQDYQFKDLDKIAAQEPDKSALADDYLICLVNLTDQCMTVAGMRPAGTDDTHWRWAPIPRTCRNCTSSYQDCANTGRYSGITSVPCNSAPFDLFVGYPIDNNNVQGALYPSITPDCDHAGGIIGID